MVWKLGYLFQMVGVATLVFFSYMRHRLYSLRRIKQLEGKVVILTGASSGLGEALAHQLFRAGCRLVLMSRNVDRLNQVKLDMLNSGKPSVVYPPVIIELDLAAPASISDCISRAISVYERVDILINNAGVSYRGEVVNTQLSVDAHLMQVNYLGQVELTRQVLNTMLEKGNGHIVFISSLQGRIALPYRSAYTASKHALHSFSDSLRAEMASRGISVTTVAPSYIHTPLSQNALTANGSRHARIDSATARGMSSSVAAEAVLDAVLSRSQETLLAPLHHRLAVMVRTLWPAVFFSYTSRLVSSNNSKNEHSSAL